MEPGDSREGGGGPLITYAIRLYNNAEFIAAAIASALAQTYSPLEILLADDCSSDGGYELATRLLAAYSGPHRIRHYRNERNLGPGGQFMRLAREMAGEILVIADGDDISLPTRSERVAQAFARGGAETMGVVCHFDLIDPAGRPLAIAEHEAGARPEAEKWTAERLARGLDGPPGAIAAYRRAVLLAGGSLAEARQSEDLALGLRAVLLGRMATVPEILVHRRVHLDNVSGPILPSWGGRELAAWYGKFLRQRLAATAAMRRDLELIASGAPQRVAEAARIRAAIAAQARETRLLIAAPRLGLCRRWFLLPLLMRLGMPWKPALRAFLQRIAPGMAMVLLRRNAIYRARRAMGG